MKNKHFGKFQTLVFNANEKFIKPKQFEKTLVEIEKNFLQKVYHTLIMNKTQIFTPKSNFHTTKAGKKKDSPHSVL